MANLVSRDPFKRVAGLFGNFKLDERGNALVAAVDKRDMPKIIQMLSDKTINESARSAALYRSIVGVRPMHIEMVVTLLNDDQIGDVYRSIALLDVIHFMPDNEVNQLLGHEQFPKSVRKRAFQDAAWLHYPFATKRLLQDPNINAEERESPTFEWGKTFDWEGTAR